MNYSLLYWFVIISFLNGAKIRREPITKRIISYPHHWIGFTDSIEFRNLVVYYIRDVNAHLPSEFRGRRLFFLFNYNEINALKTYFSFQNEGIEVQRILNMLEECYQIFFKRANYSKESNPREQYKLDESECGTIEGNLAEEDQIKVTILLYLIIRQVIQLMADLKKQPTVREEEIEKLEILGELAKTFRAVNLEFQNYSKKYFLDLRKARRYASFKLREHGEIADLRAQLSDALSEFDPEKGCGEHKVEAAHRILANHGYTYSITHFVETDSKLFARCVANETNVHLRKMFIEWYERSHFQILYYSAGEKKKSPSFYKLTRLNLCQSMRKVLRARGALREFLGERYLNDLTTATNFFEVCFEQFPELFDVESFPWEEIPL
jgi:hypothetical protein